MARLFNIVLTLALSIAALFRAADWTVKNVLPSHFVFDHQELQAIVKDSLNSLDIDASAEQVMARVHENLKVRYGENIVDTITQESWVFNNAGNAMGTMTILHASLTEYLIFFGTAVGTEGHTGNHLADDYFTILYGEQLAAPAYASKPERYLPGDQHHLPYLYNKQYAMPSGSFALELAQGYIPTMLPFGMIEVLTSTFDFYNFAKTVQFTAAHIVGNILRGKF